MEVCGWEAEFCGENCESLLGGLDPAVRATLERMAVERLWKWTNRRFGLCDEVVRPCRRNCPGVSGGVWPVVPILAGGHFINFGCGSCGRDCSCRTVHEVLLPGPVEAITEILIDGVELSLDDVRVDNWSLLVRTDGGSWPACQDLNVNGDEVGAWQITYQRGEPVPAGGGLMAGVLACEFAKSICGESSCRLPRRVQTIERQGIGIAAVLDRFEDLEKGRSGIYEIDDWVATQNSEITRRGGTVSSPDVPKPRFTTWTVGVS